jgi:hypothetical protein
MLVPRRLQPRPYGSKPATMEQPLEASLNAFAVTFEGRINVDNN